MGLLAPGTAFGGVTRLSDGAIFPTLTAAAADAATANGETLVLDAGTLTEAGSVTINDNLTISGPGATLKANAAGTSVLTIGSGKTLTLTDLSIVGTGIHQRGVTGTTGTLIATDVTFDTAYDGDFGGGVYVSNGSVTLTRVTFQGTAGTPLADQGGALWVGGGGTTPVTLTDVTFIDTEADQSGGAIYASNVALTCDGCVFDGGDAATNGGGIYSSGGSLTVRRSRFCGVNGGGNGGAIYGASGGTLENNIFGQNTAGNGGAVYAFGGAWTITNNHVIGNTGGGAIQTGGTGATLTARNNLFLDNDGFGISLFSAGTPIVAHNWFDGNVGTLNNGGTLDGTNVTTGGDPDLADLSTNCLTGDLWPSPVTSGLLDAGEDGVPYDDLDGTRNDIGAYGGPEAGPGVDSAHFVYADADSDGLTYLHECDDENGANFPGNVEVCDGGDNNCDGLVDDADPGITGQALWYPDCDKDGHGGFIAEQACFLPTDCDYFPAEKYEYYVDDCDDSDPFTYEGADEYCFDGGADRNCDGDPDLGAVDSNLFYLDQDGDGFGDDNQVDAYCVENAPNGTTATPGDCDDSESSTYPGAPDECDASGIDSDCGGADGDADSGTAYYTDADEDGYGDKLGAPIYACDPPVGATTEDLALDCNDNDSQINPDAQEVCNLVDDDCNTEVDDGVAPSIWYEDADEDGFGNEDVTIEVGCPDDAKWTDNPDDCVDTDPLINPDADEICNSVDDDCDYDIDQYDPELLGASYGYADTDRDGYGGCYVWDPECEPYAYCADLTPYDWYDIPEDCDDLNPDAYPGAEEVVGNDTDEDCDGIADPGEVKLGGGCSGCASTTPGGSVWLVGLLPTLLLRRRLRR
ncbi:MAG: MopE-related protein [Myxococcota bacterium]